eukprot:scaffold9614_cov118-Isochrysis_galbana.AAC.2
MKRLLRLARQPVKPLQSVSGRRRVKTGLLVPASESHYKSHADRERALSQRGSIELGVGSTARHWGWRQLPGPGRRENAWAPVKYWAPLPVPNPRLDAIAKGPELRIPGRGKPYLARGGRIRERVWAAGGRGFLPIAGGGPFGFCVSLFERATQQPPNPQGAAAASGQCGGVVLCCLYLYTLHS